MKNTRLLTLVAVLSASVVTATPVQDEQLRAGLQGQMRAYTRALQAGDAHAVTRVLSREMLFRIGTRGPAETFDDNMELFVAREQRKLHRLTAELGHLNAGQVGFAVEAVETVAGGAALAAAVSLNGRQLPKPFYFVEEDGQYTLNLVRPSRSDVTVQEGNDYLVRNQDSVWRSFICAGQSQYLWVQPYPAGVYVFCSDACGWWDGSRFTASSVTVYCDYNTWGDDMYIRNGYPVCHDAC